MLPWLQDTPDQDVGTRWNAAYRDVRILDSQNRLRGIFNLTHYDLARPENRAALKQLLLEAAKATDVDSDRLPDDWEMHYFGKLSATAESDSDGDGASDFTEFAFGTDPRDASSRRALGFGIHQAGTERRLSTKFLRRSGAQIEYVVESSSDLKAWQAAAEAGVSIQTPKNLFDGSGTSSTECSVILPAGRDSARFLRVRALPRN